MKIQPIQIVSRNGEQSVRQYPNAMGLFLVGRGRTAIPRPRITEAPITNFSDWLDYLDHMLDEADRRAKLYDAGVKE